MNARPSRRRIAGAALTAATVGQLLLALPLNTAYAGDGAGADSASNSSCAPGYYYCWSKIQQKSVCTTRRCY